MCASSVETILVPPPRRVTISFEMVQFVVCVSNARGVLASALLMISTLLAVRSARIALAGICKKNYVALW